jgi:hypothetical protein
MSDHPNMPPGANADLLRIEREQEEFDKRLAEIEREMRNDPQVIIDNLDEDEIARRLLRMLKRCVQHKDDVRYGVLSKSLADDLLSSEIRGEWEGAITEAMRNVHKQMGID